MANFIIDIDFTMSKRVYIDAESQGEAIKTLKLAIQQNPYDYAHNFDAYVCSEIIDVNEE